MTLDLHRPETYVDGAPHEEFARLRREEPVFFQEMDDEPGYWAVLRHADVVHVAKHSEIFSASEGGVVIEDLDPASLEQMRDMLLAMDPPRHTAYRRPIAPEFKARVIGEMEGRIRTITREILDRADAIGPDLEFVHDVCAHLPSQVVGELVSQMQSEGPIGLVVTPDGTRSGHTHWKSGFYRIAREAEMPVTLGYVDRTTMTTGLGPTIDLTGDVAHDMERIRAFYADKAGYRPERRVEPRLAEEDRRI